MSGRLSRKLHTGRTVICPSGTLKKSCSLRVTLMPEDNYSSDMASCKETISRLRICGIANVSDTCINVQAPSCHLTTESPSRPRWHLKYEIRIATRRSPTKARFSSSWPYLLSIPDSREDIKAWSAPQMFFGLAFAFSSDK